jgi:hypothetical protein
MSHRTATIVQITPMPDRWEFHSVEDWNEGEAPRLRRSSILGLALADIPNAEYPGGREIVYFGNDNHGRGSEFKLYMGSGAVDMIPFYSNLPQQRGLGIAPIGSPDDYFEEEVSQAVDQINAEKAFDSEIFSVFRSLDGLPQEIAIQGVDNYFKLTSGKFRYDATMPEWQKTMDALNALRDQKGIAEVVATIARAGRMSFREVSARSLQKVA